MDPPATASHGPDGTGQPKLGDERLRNSLPAVWPTGAQNRGGYQFPVASRTMTGHRMTMNSTGKMHTIIGTASLAGRL